AMQLVQEVQAAMNIANGIDPPVVIDLPHEMRRHAIMGIGLRLGIRLRPAGRRLAVEDSAQKTHRVPFPSGEGPSDGALVLSAKWAQRSRPPRLSSTWFSALMMRASSLPAARRRNSSSAASNDMPSRQARALTMATTLLARPTMRPSNTAP